MPSRDRAADWSVSKAPILRKKKMNCIECFHLKNPDTPRRLPQFERGANGAETAKLEKFSDAVDLKLRGLSDAGKSRAFKWKQYLISLLFFLPAIANCLIVDGPIDSRYSDQRIDETNCQFVFNKYKNEIEVKKAYKSPINCADK